jgi:hypothetical protein
MSEHRATVEWQRSGEFRYETYSRAHTLRFDGIRVPGNASRLWFLHFACQRKWVVERWISRVTLRPDVTFPGNAPTAEELRALHHQAHEKCFIANSVKTEVLIEPC